MTEAQDAQRDAVAIVTSALSVHRSRDDAGEINPKNALELLRVIRTILREATPHDLERLLGAFSSLVVGLLVMSAEEVDATPEEMLQAIALGAEDV